MKRLALVALALMALTVAQSALAQESKVKIYGALSYVAPLSETDENIGGVTDAVKASNEFGYNLGLEFRTSSMLGIELDYLYAKQDIEHGTAGVLGETTFQPISATLNFHLPMGMLDLYGGPTAAYVNWGDLKVESGGDVSIDPEFAIGISAGVDVNVAPKIAVMGGLRWLNLKAEPDGSTEALDVNPLFARIGVAIRL